MSVPVPQPAPQPAPPPTTSPPPAPDYTTALLDYNYRYTWNLGLGYLGLRDSSGVWYKSGADRDQCMMVTADTARCWLWLWREETTQDANFRQYLSRYTYRIAVFSVNLYNGVAQSYTDQGFFAPYDLICTDVWGYAVPACSPNGPS